MGTTPLGLQYPDPSATPNRQQIEDLATTADDAIQYASRGGDPWTSWSPSWTAITTNPAIGNGTLAASYVRSGKRVSFKIRILAGSTTTFGSGVYQLSLPFAAITGFNPGICGWVLDSSAALYIPANAINTPSVSSTQISLAVNSGRVSNTVPFTFAVGDEINIGGTYEIA